MKRTLGIFLLLAFAVLGWGMFVRQQQLMEELSQKVETSVLQQVEYRRQAELALKEKLESKKKAEQFMVQREYEKEIEGVLASRLDEFRSSYTEGFSRFSDESKQRMGELENRFAMLAGDQKALLSQQTQAQGEVAVLRGQVAKLETETAALRRALDDAGAQSGRVQEQLAAEKTKSGSLQRQVDALRTELQALRVKTAAPAVENPPVPKGEKDAI